MMYADFLVQDEHRTHNANCKSATTAIIEERVKYLLGL
jgi:hypothetical protein